MNLLRDEVAPSDVSGLTVDRDLLVPSDLSGRRGLRRELVKCDVSGALLLPDETATCAVTGKRAGRDQLVQSSLSGRWMLASEAERSDATGQLFCPDEATFCHWYEDYFENTKTAVCQRTGLTFARRLLSPSGEFTILRKLVRGVYSGRTQPAPELVPWLRQQCDGKLKSVEHAWYVSPKGGNVRAVLVDLQTFGGLRIRYAGLVVSVKDEPTVLSPITRNTKKPPGWREL